MTYRDTAYLKTQHVFFIIFTINLHNCDEVMFDKITLLTLRCEDWSDHVINLFSIIRQGVLIKSETLILSKNKIVSDSF